MTDSVMHLKPWSRTYSAVCGCILDRRKGKVRGVVDYYPCEFHEAFRWRLVEREDGAASIFVEDRAAWVRIAQDVAR